LNANAIGADERIEIGEKLKFLSKLRVQDLKQQLTDIEKEVAAMVKIHSQRMQSYGVTSP
jgi:hypothetical protein